MTYRRSKLGQECFIIELQLHQQLHLQAILLNYSLHLAELLRPTGGRLSFIH